jgi:hypothetical protein
MYTFPVAIYRDPLKQKRDIFKKNNKKSRIYRWTNKLPGKTYIGFAIYLTQRFKSSFSLAFLEKELSNGNSVICSSLLKYGYSEFRNSRVLWSHLDYFKRTILSWYLKARV